MSDDEETTGNAVSLARLIPNMLTITAICAGLTAIRFGIEGNYRQAVLLIVLAAVLDGIDGRIARLLKSSSPIGAELDSLADFLNFGVAAPLLVYFWALRDMQSAAWMAVLIYAICCVLRLARFNVDARDATRPTSHSAYFVGVPSPAGAMLVMLPLFLSLAFSEAPLVPDFLIMAWMVIVGFLMISRIPTWSFKTTRISRRTLPFFLVGVAFAGAMVLTYPWITLVALCLLYVGAVGWAWIGMRPRRRARGR